MKKTVFMMATVFLTMGTAQNIFAQFGGISIPKVGGGKKSKGTENTEQPSQTGTVEEPVKSSKSAEPEYTEDDQKLDATASQLSNAHYKVKEVMENDGCYGSSSSMFNNIISYESFAALKKAYTENPSKRKTDETLAIIADFDKFYTERVPQCFKAEFLPDWESYKNGFEQKKKDDPSYTVTSLGNRLNELDKYTDYSPNDPTITSTKAEITTMRSETQKYIDSGEHQRYLDSKNAEKLSKVTMPKAAKTHAEWEKKAKSVVAERYGEALRAVTVTSGWQIEKDEYGLILSRYEEVIVAYKDKETGRCYMRAVRFKQEYAGGGYYSNETAPYIQRETAEIACENVNK